MKSKYLLCGVDEENMDHLFFSCSFANELWSGIMNLCGLRRRVGDWSYEVNWAMKYINGKSLLNMILRIVRNAHRYEVWRERNNRLYSKLSLNVQKLLDQIKFVVQVQIFKVSHIALDYVNLQLSIAWGLPSCMISSWFAWFSCCSFGKL